MQAKTRMAVLATMLAAGGAVAYAANAAAENDALAINKAQVSLTQAVAAAERQHPGAKATRAAFEHSRSKGWVYDVEVVNGAQVFDVKVDAQQGTVVSSIEDKADSGHDNDAHD